jgi:sugar phosphate isomerase/epimerase
MKSGYDGVLSIEHEDADYGWPGKDLDARYEGERQALAHLQKALERT